MVLTPTPPSSAPSRGRRWRGPPRTSSIPPPSCVTARFTCSSEPKIASAPSPGPRESGSPSVRTESTSRSIPSPCSFPMAGGGSPGSGRAGVKIPASSSRPTADTSAVTAHSTANPAVSWSPPRTISSTGRSTGRPLPPRPFARRWSKSGSIVTTVEDGRLIAARIDGRFHMYWGEGTCFLATSDDLVHWVPLQFDAGADRYVTHSPGAGSRILGDPRRAGPPHAAARPRSPARSLRLPPGGARPTGRAHGPGHTPDLQRRRVAQGGRPRDRRRVSARPGPLRPPRAGITDRPLHRALRARDRPTTWRARSIRCASRKDWRCSARRGSCTTAWPTRASAMPPPQPSK